MVLSSLMTFIISLVVTVAIYTSAPLTSRYYYSYVHEVLGLTNINYSIFVGFVIYELLHTVYMFQAAVFPILLICAYSSQTVKQIALLNLKSKDEHRNIQTYKEVLLMNIYFRDCFSSYILPILHAATCTSLAFNNVTTIGFHKYLPYPLLFAFGFTAISVTLGVFYTLPEESSISTESKEYLNVLKSGSLGKWTSKYEKAVIRSIRPLRIQIGGFFYLKRASTLKILSFLLLYTLKLIIFFRK